MKNRILVLLLVILPVIGFSQVSSKDKKYLIKELSAKINNLRVSKGLSPLYFNDTLRRAAEYHSKYMAQNFILSSEEKSGKFATPEKRIQAFGGRGYQAVGENLFQTASYKFPLKKKDLEQIVNSIYNGWYNSIPHYASLVEPEFNVGDFGFKANETKGVVFVTLLMAKKGYIVKNQLSNNSFGLELAGDGCESDSKEYTNLMMNLGNSLVIEGNEVIMYYHNIETFNAIFSGPNDGVAIDLVSPNQVKCGTANQLDASPIYDGILLKPYYRDEMLKNNRAESEYRIITKVGDIPAKMNGKEYSPSLIVIKDNKACKYFCPAIIPKKDYSLKRLTPILKDVEVDLTDIGIIRSTLVSYNFNTDQATSISLPKIDKSIKKVHSIQINSFSSVEGDSAKNAQLHNARAQFIKNHLKNELRVSDNQIRVIARENWDLMAFQLNYYMLDNLSKLSHAAFRKYLPKRDSIIPWDSLFFNQRKSDAIINYYGTYSDVKGTESLASFNLRTGVIMDNQNLVNKALYTLYNESGYDSDLLFEAQIVEYVRTHPDVVANYAALMTRNYGYASQAVTEFLFNWLDRSDELDDDAKNNLLILYTLISEYYIDNWDISTQRLSNVIHPQKIEKIIPQNIKDEVLLNLNLAFIQYYGQINDSKNTSKSFQYITSYFKFLSFTPEDDANLALFFNYWSAYNEAVEFLLPRFEKDELNEDGVFTLAQTMNYANYESDSEIYLNVHKKAVSLNPTRWCEWVNKDFQVKRNFLIKRLYCETCK